MATAFNLSIAGLICRSFTRLIGDRMPKAKDCCVMTRHKEGDSQVAACAAAAGVKPNV